MKRFILVLTVLLTMAGGAIFPVSATEKAPDFTLTSIHGKPFALHDYVGKNTIVLNFWAAWCDSCQEEMPLLLKLKNQYAASSDVIFLGVNAGDSERAAGKFIEKTGYTYAILMDNDKSVSKLFKVMGLPQTLVISKDGNIVYRGSRPPASLDTMITASTLATPAPGAQP